VKPSGDDDRLGERHLRLMIALEFYIDHLIRGRRWNMDAGARERHEDELGDLVGVVFKWNHESGDRNQFIIQGWCGELDCSELSVLSVDQPTVTGAGVETAGSRTLESVITRMSAIRFIVLSRQTSLQYFDVIAAHLDALRFVGRSLPSWRTSPRSCFPILKLAGLAGPLAWTAGTALHGWLRMDAP
jgi:hypothetical protein